MALTANRFTPTGGPFPSRGTYPVAADVVIYKGAMVALDSSGRAMPAGALAGGSVRVVGKSSAYYDNDGGAAAAFDVEVEFGVFGWQNSADADAIADDDAGKACYAVDDQTVALTSSSATLPSAGLISEVGEDGNVYVWMGPQLAKLGDAVATADAGVALQKRTVTVGHADLTDADTSQTISIGAVLPANARILGVAIHTVTTFAGGTATDLVVDIGTADDVDALIDGADVFGTIVDGQALARPLGIAPNKLFASAGAQLTATFVSTGDNLVNLTSGTCTIDVLFSVLA